MSDLQIYIDGPTENEMKEIGAYKDDIENHIKQRTLKNQMDYQFFKKIDKK